MILKKDLMERIKLEFEKELDKKELWNKEQVKELYLQAQVQVMNEIIEYDFHKIDH